MKLTIPFTIASKNKILRINLTKEVQNVYSANHKTLLKEMKENLNKWKNIHGHGLED